MKYEEMMQGLKQCSSSEDCDVTACPYSGESCCMTALMYDAYDTLKRLEPPARIERVTFETGEFQHVCGACGAVVDEFDQYCRKCGRGILK